MQLVKREVKRIRKETKPKQTKGDNTVLKGEEYVRETLGDKQQRV